jgi:hypothetical protein
MWTAQRSTDNRPPPESLERISILRERTSVGNREQIAGVLRCSPLTPLAYFDIKATADVPVGSFDRTLAALVREGTVLKGEDGYLLAEDGSASKSEETHAGSGIFMYCARCEGSHLKPGKGSGETLEDVHRRAIAP